MSGTELKGEFGGDTHGLSELSYFSKHFTMVDCTCFWAKRRNSLYNGSKILFWFVVHGTERVWYESWLKKSLEPPQKVGMAFQAGKKSPWGSTVEDIVTELFDRPLDQCVALVT